MAANLFYVIGASGAGKDSLLDYVREHLPTAASVAFAHRYITRPATAGGENHVALSREEFETRAAHRCFAMHWHSHGLDYGIGNEIHDWLEKNLHVVMNGSREYLPTAAGNFSQLVPVLIQADLNVLRDRLSARGRESNAGLEARLDRGIALDNIQHPALVRLDNNGELQHAGQSLLQLICRDPV